MHCKYGKFQRKMLYSVYLNKLNFKTSFDNWEISALNSIENW